MSLPLLSGAEAARAALNLPDTPHISIMRADLLRGTHCPPFPVDKPAYIVGITSHELAQEISASFLALYPASHPVDLVNVGSTGEITHTVLESISDWPFLGQDTVLYIPALGENTSMEAFHEVIAHLRAPDGCPWDRKQTHSSLRPYLLEETYELLTALDANEPQKMCEEFGDLLLQIVLHAQVAREAGTFTLADIIQAITQKIIYRHPHVFGEVEVDGVGGVLVNWEKLKAQERAANGESEKGMLDSVPVAMPALVLAQEYQSRAARVGFDWSEIQPVLEKVLEEFEEVQSAPDDESRARELGDLLFAVVNLVRWHKVDAESALRETNQRFHKRFQYIERRARETGRHLSDMTLTEMDVYWEEAKAFD